MVEVFGGILFIIVIVLLVKNSKLKKKLKALTESMGQATDVENYCQMKRDEADAYYREKQVGADTLVSDAEKRINTIRQSIAQLRAEKSNLQNELKALTLEDKIQAVSGNPGGGYGIYRIPVGKRTG